MHQPGIEPGSTAWKAVMLTITPLTLCDRVTADAVFHDFLLDIKNLEGPVSQYPSLKYTFVKLHDFGCSPDNDFGKKSDALGNISSLLTGSTVCAAFTLVF